MELSQGDAEGPSVGSRRRAHGDRDGHGRLPDGPRGARGARGARGSELRRERLGHDDGRHIGRGVARRTGCGRGGSGARIAGSGSCSPVTVTTIGAAALRASAAPPDEYQ